MKEKSLKVLVIVLTILVLGLGCFIVYDKVLNNKNTNNDNKNNNIQEEPKEDTEKDNLEEKLQAKADAKNLTIKKYLEEYMIYIPFNYDKDDKLKNISIEDIYNNNEEISFSIWMYVWLNASDVDNRSLDVKQVDDFVYEYFNLKNYEVKEKVIGEPSVSNIFGLTKKNNKYIATMEPTEWGFPIYEVFDVKYLEDSIEVSFKVPFTAYPTKTKIYTDEGTLYLKYNNGNFNFSKIEFVK